MKPHVHAKLIKQWADGAQIQRKEETQNGFVWVDTTVPQWNPSGEYRVKPSLHTFRYKRYIRLFSRYPHYPAAIYILEDRSPEFIEALEADPDIIWLDENWIETVIDIPNLKE